MRPKKKSLSLSRETLRQLTPLELSEPRAGVINRTYTCPTHNCPTFTCPTYQNSCFNSCYHSDCCLEIP